MSMKSSESHFSICFKTPKTPEQIEDELRSHKKRKEFISTLPFQKGWSQFTVRCYQGFWFPETTLSGVMALQDHFKADPTDLFLVTYPKSGTTWLKALAFAISDRGTAAHHHPSSPHHPLLHLHPQECSPYLEGLFSKPQIPDLDVLQSPRILGSHIPYSSLPESVRTSGCRIVYLCRDPKDTLVSTWHFLKEMLTEGMELIPFDEAFESFCTGKVPYGPVWDHMLGYWRESLQRPGEVMFLRYEEMMEDPSSCVRQLAGFMGLPFTTEEEREGVVEEIVRLCSFEKLSGLEVNKSGVLWKDMGWNAKRSCFFRKGKVGDWREHLTPEMAERLDSINQHKLDGSGLSFMRAPPLA